MKCVHFLRDFLLISLSKHATVQQKEKWESQASPQQRNKRKKLPSSILGKKLDWYGYIFLGEEVNQHWHSPEDHQRPSLENNQNQRAFWRKSKPSDPSWSLYASFCCVMLLWLLCLCVCLHCMQVLVFCWLLACLPRLNMTVLYRSKNAASQFVTTNKQNQGARFASCFVDAIHQRSKSTSSSNSRNSLNLFPLLGKESYKNKQSLHLQYSNVKPEDRRIWGKEKMLLPPFQVLKCGSVQLHQTVKKEGKNELWLAYFLHKVPIKAGREMCGVDGVQAAVFLHRQSQLGRNC